MAPGAYKPLSRQQYGRLLEGMLPRSGGYARSILHNCEDAQDAVQQAALRGLQRIDSFDPQRSFAAWWFTILRHCCIDLTRQRRHTSLETITTPPVGETSSRDDAEELMFALARLDRHHGEILRLKYFAGMSYAELAEALDIPIGTVMSRLHQARKSLAAELERIQS